MKIKILNFLILISLSSFIKGQSAWTNQNRLLPDKLREIPVGIFISHDPNPCYPVKIDSLYYWKHSTKVISTEQDLEVVACGSFIWYDKSGWHANMNYSKEEFANAFNCPNGILKSGQTYTYAKNWRVGKQVYDGDALWYVLAKDKNGKLFKGSALVETEKTLQK